MRVIGGRLLCQGWVLLVLHYLCSDLLTKAFMK